MFKKLLILVTMLGFPLVALAQQGTLTGTVSDGETGELLPGATVFIPELSTGGTTNLDGVYRVTNVPYGSYEVVVSFVGYRTVRRTVEIASSEVTQDFELRIDAIGLDDVIVSGYAPQLKREVTGAISSVTSRDIVYVPLQNTEGFLQGRAAGVNVTSVSGAPGGAFRVQIRGNGSINAATQPLYIVDGVQISFSQRSSLASNSPLNTINPDDIESIEVIKDAASAAIYGAQAAAGVVLITTKRGSEAQTRITARVETGIRNATQEVDYLNRDQYLDWAAEARQFSFPNETFEEARENRVNFYRNFFGSPLEADDPLAGDPTGRDLADTNWQDFIYDQGVVQKYNLSIAGGTSSTTFRISGGFEDTQGHVFRTGFERLNLRTNLDHRFNDRFSTGVTINIARTYQFGICDGGNFINCPPSQAMFEAPMSFPFLPDGSYNPETRFGVDTNPAVIADEVDRNATQLSILGNLTANYRITDWLSVRGLIGMDYRNTKDELYESEIVRAAWGGRVLLIDRVVENMTTNLVFNASHTFDNVHNLSGFLGTEYRRNYSESFSAEGRGFPIEQIRVIGATAEPFSVGGSFTEFRFAGYFLRAAYNYDERYFVNVVGRYDGSSRFGSETRWGFFPSISGAWRISDENFFNVDVIDELRLRAGYGTTGNSAIGNFAARGLYSVSGQYMNNVGLAPSQLANANLGWEEAREVNVGLDFGFLEGRIAGAIDMYRKDNVDLLFGRPLPSDSGFGSITENIGSVRNEGIEFEINSVNVNTADFTWSTRFNIAFNRNEVLSLPEGETLSPNSFLNQIKEGDPLGQINAIRWAGVNPADGRPMWYDIDGNITYNPSQVNDSVPYKDGVANRVGGFGNTLSYRGFTLDAFFQFSFGQWAFANTDWFFTRTLDFNMNLDEMVLDRWQQPGDITYFPRAVPVGASFPETANFRTQTASHAIYNTSYVRLKNLTLSYNAPRSITEPLQVSNLRVFLTGVNLLTFTNYPFYDPEVAVSETTIFGNITVAQYPTARQFNAGIEITF